MSLLAAACSKNGNPSISLAEAVTSVNASATALTVKSYQNSRQVTVLKGSPEYEKVVNYLYHYAPERQQPRYHEIAGKIEEITIPYVLNYVLTFKMDDKSTITFDFGYDKIWFTTEKTLYAGLVNLELNGVLNEIVGN